jgi:hypothetical protein
MRSSTKHEDFVREPQGRTAMANVWAFRSVVTHW